MKQVIEALKLNELADNLIGFIKNRTNIFSTLQIICPNMKMQQWFKSYWLKTQDDILMNVEFLIIDEALLKLIDTDKPYRLLKRDTLKSFIIKHLSIKNDELVFPSKINSYLYNKDGSINSIKIYDLANELSKLFLDYEKDQVEIIGWERKLYELVLKDASSNNLATLDYVYKNKKGIKTLKEELYFFGFNNFSSLQQSIIDCYANNADVTMMLLKQDEEYKQEYVLTSAPSKLREVESVHTKICSLLKDTDNKYSDFLVLANDISAYEGVIPRVFNQDNVNFPNIPYVINDRKLVDTNVSVGLKKLFEIYNKKYYTRLDFFELINNKDIQEARGITDSDVDNFSKSIVAMNVYRKNDNSDDWDYAKKRVLLSKISGINDVDNNIVELKDNDYLPYSNISFDNASIVKFVKLIDDLSSWQKLLSEIKYINNENLLLVKEELNKWFSIKDLSGFETNKYYKNVLDVFNFWYTMNISNNSIPLNTLFYMLFDASTVMQVNKGDYFTRGITFADFDVDSILSAKYVFFLNASSNELPRLKVKSELDLRNYDITEKEKMENAFFIQYQNAFKFYISYVDKDLKTDEDFFKSSFVIDLEKRLKVDEEKISLDETRSWEELYTKREYKNKDYYLTLLSYQEELIEKEETINKYELLKKIKVKDMADFLEEPLKYKASILFGKSDELDENMKDEYEPLELDALTSSILSKKIMVDLLTNKKEALSEKHVEELKNRFNLEHKLPNINNVINEESFTSTYSKAVEVYKYVNDITNGNYEIVTIPDVIINEWVLTNNQEVCRYVDNTTRTYIQMKKLIDKTDAYKEYLFLYVISLMDVITLPENTYEIKLSRKMSVSYEITPSEARQILIDIYELMNDYEEIVYLPITIFYKDKIKTLDALIENLLMQNGSPWGYFDDKKMFDYEKQLGYTNENFYEKYKKLRNKRIKLIKYLKEIQEESEVNENETVHS